MDLFSMEFLSALAAIVVIDLVLAGDNAIVIALAARNLPPRLRRKAIAWGTAGAILVRSAMTLAVVWLLKVPGLLFAGGALLVWIAHKLLVDDGSGRREEPGAATGFWGAMRTIVIADALMGLDNVLGVAGAAHGSFLLVVLGLLISIPIVVGGSQVILKWVERYAVIVYIGAGVLAWTAVTMMLGEPYVKGLVERYPAVEWGAYLAVVGGVLTSGFRANHARKRARVAQHLVDAWIEPAAVPRKAVDNIGGKAMMKILIPVDPTANSTKAVRHAIDRYLGDGAMEIHLLHVRTPLSQYAARFVSRSSRTAWHRAEAEKALAPARDLLQQFGVPFAAHVELGDEAVTIDRVARRLNVDQIVMGTARKNSFTRLLEDSVTNKVLELSRVPVEVVAGEAVSRFERVWLPAGIGAALALLLAAAD